MQISNDPRQGPGGTEPPANDQKSVIQFLKELWTPKQIQPPIVDPDLPKLNAIQRSAEVLRYTVLSVEWWFSPNGTLREWLRLNGSASSMLLIPAVLIAPLITFLIWQLLAWAVVLVHILWNIVIAAAIIGGAAFLLKALRGR